MHGDTQPRARSTHEAPPTVDARWHRVRARISAFAVTLVTVTALATAVVVTYTDSGPHQQSASAVPVAAVPAPPPVIRAPHPNSRTPARAADRQVASAMQHGTDAACSACGVIESVVALEPRAQDEPVAYQMRIRMDDGSLRTVEQRDALATGSRVMVAGGSVRPVPGRPGPG